MRSKDTFKIVQYVRLCLLMLAGACVFAVGLFMFIQHVNSANSTAMDNVQEKAQNN